MSQPFCGARTRSGEPCRKRVILGGTRCATHGGSSPQAKAAAARRLAEQRARRTLLDLGRPEPVTDPLGELARLAGEVIAFKDAALDQVRELDELCYRGSIGAGVEQVRGEVDVFLRAAAACDRILVRQANLALDERVVLLREAEVALYVAAVGRVLDRLGLDDTQQRMARVWLAAELGVSETAALPAGGGS